MGSERLFFKELKNSRCKHTNLAECEKTRSKCWYREHLTHHCLESLHDKSNHSKCKGEYLVGYTADRGAALYHECECLCHQDKYYSPFIGRWL